MPRQAVASLSEPPRLFKPVEEPPFAVPDSNDGHAAEQPGELQMGTRSGGRQKPFKVITTMTLSLAILLSVTSSNAAQNFRGKHLYFGDMHWHSCASQDADATLTSQYESMFNDFGLDFSMSSEHAEGAEAGISGCDTYLPEKTGIGDH